jgi:hypothetical protein
MAADGSNKTTPLLWMERKWCFGLGYGSGVLYLERSCVPRNGLYNISMSGLLIASFQQGQIDVIQFL